MPERRGPLRVELSQLPAIHLGGECVLPQRRMWDVKASDADLAALGRAAEAVAEHGGRLPLDAEALRVLASAIEVVQLVAKRVEDSAVGGAAEV